MSTILVAVTPMAGHVNPMLVVAESLRARGHDVIFTTSELFREKVDAAGIRFVPLLGNANYDYRRLGELIPGLQSAAPGTDQAIHYIKHVFGDRIPDQDRGLRQILSEQHVDLVMTDIGFFGILPMLLRGGRRPPVVSCGVIAPIWLDPAFSVFSGPDTTPVGITRNVEDNRLYAAARAPAFRYVDTVLEKLGVSIPGGGDENTRYRLPDLFLQFGAEAFEYPTFDRPANLRFTGPILPTPKAATKPPAWLDRLDPSKPVVFVTQGTLANFDFNQLVNPALAGLADDDVQLIVTAGGSTADTIIAPSTVIVEPYIPYDIVLPKTSAFVTNGGYNGVQQALAYGVPIVSAGVTEDKRQVAGRVNWSGAGIGMQTSTPTPHQLRDAVRAVLRDPRYRTRAKALGANIANTNALATIAEQVESTIARATDGAVRAIPRRPERHTDVPLHF
ncbi:MAG TPA: nucleotide disphospho-sugar-binding domain-containing protein [Gemmatimonadaceae bacterium]|nr:nucleotide disphospho-sugar-binding domain-containing protein [Gemmatimonadaceae bacterium]